jgi:uncharacterized protein (TIGR02145 family)
MKKLFTLFALVFLTFRVIAQAPEKMGYQAVIRNAGNNLVTNHAVGMRISILQGSATGTPVYVETQTATTNDNGLVTVEIGDGTPVTGTFEEIDWSAGTYFIKIETDPVGGINYTITGISQILSVPYALYARSAANGFSGNYNDLINKPVILNDALYSTATGSRALTSNTGAANTAHGWQALYLNTNGYNNTATGIQALWSNGSGFNNTANGAWALMHNTNGNSNTAIGYNALSANISGYSNTANGAWALYSNNTGFHNTAFGVSSLYTNEDGTDNTAIGLDALFSNKTGKNNTAIGISAGNSNTEGSNNVFLGSSAGYYETGSNKLFIDNQQRVNESDAREKALIYGVFDADPANQVLTINGNVNLNSNKITNVANPVNDKDAATKTYVDNALKELGLIPNNYSGLVSDIDGNTYKTITIGTQTWMAENLRVGSYKDGTAIPLVTDNTAWGNLTTPGYCWYNNDEAIYKATYGALYNWYTVNTGTLCPTGWHVPTDDEWTTLTAYLGGESTAGGKLKETGTAHWISPNTGATNETGFTALPGGYRYSTGTYFNIGIYGTFWSSTGYSATDAWFRYMLYSNSIVKRDSDNKDYGFSVRCLRDI